MVNQVRVDKERKWKMADVGGLQKSQLDLPNYAYLLPSIDRLVDGAIGHNMLSF